MRGGWWATRRPAIQLPPRTGAVRLAEPIYNWERREKLLEIARRLDELAALAAVRVEQAERAAAARRAAHAALLAEARERIRSFDPLSSRPDPRSLEALYELALRERTAESPGTASDASWDWPSLSDYWHYLIHPSQMDSDLQTYQQIALGTSALALGGAGGLAAAGLSGLTVGAAAAAATPLVVTELADTAVEEAASQIAGVPIILPFGVVDVVQDTAKLGVKKLAQEGLEEVAESVASKATRSGDTAGAASSIPKTYDRPSGFRKGVREEVWESAKGPDGKVLDPVTGTEIISEQPWDLGHRPGFEFRKHQRSAMERAIDRKRFLDEHNDPSHYRSEPPVSNRSHAGEDNTDGYFGYE